MFGLDSLSRPVAIAEMLFLLSAAALLGWLLGRLARNGRVRALRAALADKHAELEAVRRPAKARPAPTLNPTPVSVAAPAAHVVVSASPAGIVSGPHLPTSADAVPPVLSGTEVPGRPESRTSAGTVDSPGMEVPGMEVPGVEVPGVDSPGVDAVVQPVSPLPDVPIVEVPPVGAPITEAPAFESPPLGTGLTNTYRLNRSFPGAQAARSLPNTFLPGNTEAAVLNRIAARSNELNFDRIGRALAAQADDLKEIVGIGPFLERKLYSLGIYTYRQIANFTKQDSDQVNDIIEFFPGRIERDNWVSQASQLYERKYGARA